MTAVALLALLATALPVLYLLVRLSEAGIQRSLETLLGARTWELMGNSLALVAAVTATAVAVGSAQAVLVVKTDLAGRRWFAALAILPLAVPSYIAAYSWLGALPVFHGFGAAWLVLSLGTSPYVFLAVAAALLVTNSAQEEVAQSLGRTPWQVTRSVVWPSARPAAAASALLVALYTLSDFGAVSLLRFDTFTRAIFNTYRSSFDRTSAAVLAVALVAVSAALVLLQRRLAAPVAASPRSARRNLLRIASGRPAAYIFLSLAALLGVGVPLFSLARWSLVGLSQADLAEVGRALVNTAGYALAGGAVTAVLAFAVALVNVRYRPRWAGALDLTMWLGHALPGVVVALALVFLSNAALPAIYQTSAIVVVAYAALFTPNAVAALSAPMRQLSTSLDDVARSLSASPLAVLRRVVAPALWPSIASSFSLIALTVIKELPATLLLRPTGIETLATRLWSQTSISAFSAAAPYALLLVVLAGIPALLMNQQVRQTLAPVPDRAEAEAEVAA